MLNVTKRVVCVTKSVRVNHNPSAMMSKITLGWGGSGSPFFFTCVRVRGTPTLSTGWEGDGEGEGREGKNTKYHQRRSLDPRRVMYCVVDVYHSILIEDVEKAKKSVNHF